MAHEGKSVVPQLGLSPLSNPLQRPAAGGVFTGAAQIGLPSHAAAPEPPGR